MESKFEYGFKSIREEIQDEEDYHEEGYTLKTNEDIIKAIVDFGRGQTEFHTLDIKRLVVENERLKKLPELFKSSKTHHELPNDNTSEYNLGYVKCCNNVINRINELL